MREQAREGFLRHGFFVGGDGKAAFGNVKRSLRGAAIGGRVVQHALGHAVAFQKGGLEDVLVRRQGKRAREAVKVHVQGLIRQADAARYLDAGKMPIHEVLQALIGGAERRLVIAELRIDLADQIGGKRGEQRGFVLGVRLEPRGDQLELYDR